MTGLTSAGESVACSSGAWGSATRSRLSKGSASLTERKSRAMTDRRAALPEITPESVTNVKRTRMHNGVAKVLELSAQNSTVCRPHKKYFFDTKRSVLGKKVGAIHHRDRHSHPGPPPRLNRVPTGRSTPERKPPDISPERTTDKHGQSDATPTSQSAQAPRHCRINESDSFHGLQERWS